MSIHVPWIPTHHPACEKPFLEGLDLSAPLHSGYMYKEAHTHVVFHRRFFVLFPGVLVYYEKEAEYQRDVARGSLEHRHKAIGLEKLYLTKPEKKVKGAKFSFILHAPDKNNSRHDFLLVTEAKEERKHWIEALQDQNPDLICSDEQSLRINPDTPQITRRHSEQSQHHHHQQHQQHHYHHSLSHEQENKLRPDYPARPGSPRHDIHKSRSPSPSADHLDIQHLNIRDGPSDTEDSN